MRSIHISTVFLVIVLLIAVSALSGCTGSMNTTPAATAEPSTTATTVPSATAIAIATPTIPAATEAPSSGPAATMEPWVPGDDTFVLTPTPDAGYNISSPWFDEHVQVNPMLDTTVVLVVKGKVNKQLSLTKYNLSTKYPQLTESVFYDKQGTGAYWLNLTGPSLNAILNDAGPAAGATSATFIGSDGFAQPISLSTIRGDQKAFIGFHSPPDDSLRNILPGQSPSAHEWVRDLVTIDVE